MFIITQGYLGNLYITQGYVSGSTPPPAAGTFVWRSVGIPLSFFMRI